MKDWDDIRIFLAVARSGSITAGAHSLGLDQSTVSRRLQAFEEKIGNNLFLGTTKRNTLSLTGEKYLEGALRIENEIKQIKKNIDVNSQDIKGTIHVVTADILSNHLLLSVTSEFLQKYPDINLLIRSQAPNSERLEGDGAAWAPQSFVGTPRGNILLTAPNLIAPSRKRN